VWRPFKEGATVGREGSERGIILRDEEHSAEARITLESGCAHGVPFAVTCGMYGWFFRTRFVGTEVEAEFPAMRDDLAAILDVIPAPMIRKPTPRWLRSARLSKPSYRGSLQERRGWANKLYAPNPIAVRRGAAPRSS
jgi:hypothetical protein